MWGVDALINRRRCSPNFKNRTDESTERAVVDYAVAFPAHGQHRTSNERRKQGIFIYGSGVRSIWLRHPLENFKKCLKALGGESDQQWHRTDRQPDRGARA
ncbi:integrase [Salmonella enterica subsp. arizonae]|uniref:Integrase n=1 Tax=Salmonella enterica subsp. arizonae TaxID=59203 RepID=A0A379SWS3_SALER|nr:integrase [Salmonella enterica subsp. arizonae]